MKINIISRDNGAGLSADTKIITEIFKSQGWDVSFSDYKSLKRFSYWSRRKYDLNVFMQWANPTWLKLTRKNILIPNPEWFKSKWTDSLKKFDGIFCKTQSAVAAFSSYNPHTVFTGFTSLNKHLPQIEKKTSRWLHIAGKSKLKGTDVIIDTWLKNPQFPHLTIVQRNAGHANLDRPNLTYLSEFIPEEELHTLMNECAIHLCPSATEGYGHSIGEALSCGALIISTDAAPMNELVTENRGFLIKPVRQEKIKMADAYFIDTKGLEGAVTEAMELTKPETMMENSRSFYNENKKRFSAALVKEITDIFSNQGYGKK